MVSAIHNRTVAATSFASAEAAKLTLIGENGRSYDEAVIGSVSPAATATPAAAGPQPAAPATQPHLHAPVDELTLSDEIGLDQAPAPDALRAARIDQIRAAIDAGTYETESRLEAAVDNLLDRLF